MIFHQKTAVTGSFCFCMLKVFPQGLLLVCRFDKEERELQSLEEQQRAKTAAALKQVEVCALLPFLQFEFAHSLSLSFRVEVCGYASFY